MPTSTTPPRRDNLAKAKEIFTYIISTLPGAAGVAVLGLLFFCCGGCGMYFSLTAQKAPTKHTIDDLEEDSKDPNSSWMEISNGQFFWPEKVTDQTKNTKTGQVTDNWHYVPLVSKSVIGEWDVEFVNRGRDSRYSYAKARVFLKISPEQLQKEFPEAEKQTVTKKSPVKGTVGRFTSISDKVMEGIKANAKDQKAGRMILINYGEEGGSSGVGVCMAIFLWLFALPFFAPLAWFLFQQLKARQQAASTPT